MYHEVNNQHPTPPATLWNLPAAALSLAALLLLLNGCAKQMVPTPIHGSAPGAASASGFAAVTRSAAVNAPPGSRPSLDEEVWVVARAARSMSARNGDNPQSGAMLTTDSTGREIPLPLKHTDVQASVVGYVSNVRVAQQFHNPFDEKIEVKYVFPLPDNAAVNEFVMTIGDRRIRGLIRERQEAEQVYAEARRQGYVAALLTQERPNVFTHSVANIEPGRDIAVELGYFQTLTWADGWYEFVFPTVVGPRFNPPGSTSGIGAAARGSTAGTGQPTTVTYLRPGERSGHDISIQLDVNAGVPIEASDCPSHVVQREAVSPERLVVRLGANDRIPNKDFVFRFRVAGGQVKSGLVTAQDDRGGFFTLMVQPPQTLSGLTRQPLELIFVLDASGSMSGRPIREAKAAIARGLRQLGPDDTFQLSTRVTAGDEATTVPVAVPVPEGVKYKTTVPGN